MIYVKSAKEKESELEQSMHTVYESERVCVCA